MMLLFSLSRSIITHNSHICRHSSLVLDAVNDHPFKKNSLTSMVISFLGLSLESVEHIGIVQAMKVVMGVEVAEEELVHEPSTVMRIVFLLIKKVCHPGAQSLEVLNVAFRPFAAAIEPVTDRRAI